MRHPASHNLLLSVFWPRKSQNRHGVLRWERSFNDPARASDRERYVRATAAVCARQLVLKTHRSFADGQLQPGLDIRWNWSVDRVPELVHYTVEGEDQPLDEAKALNHFKGHVYRMNVAPDWER